jgi:ketosteroid isomerase-like protein
MKTMKFLMLVTTLLAGIANAMSEEFDPQRFSAQWDSAYARRDAGSLAAMYAPDAVLIPPSQQIIGSRRSIEAFWAEKQRNGTSDFRYALVNTHNEGGRVTQTGTWSADVESNGVVSRFGGDLTQVIAQQPDGSWKIEVQNWQ